jgi:thioredoxin 1
MNAQTTAAPAQTKAGTVTLVDWYADWCGPCRAMEPVLEEIEQELAGKLTIERIDVDKNQEKANAAGVMSMPTFHIKKGDKIVQTLIGYQNKEELSKHLQNALSA